MKKIQYIQGFFFDYAQYRLSDGKSDVLLQIYYKENSYTIKSEEDTIDNSFKKEIQAVAQKLLKRKHGVNRVKYL